MLGVGEVSNERNGGGNSMQSMSNDGGFSMCPAGSEVYDDHVACLFRCLAFGGRLGERMRARRVMAFVERDDVPSGIATVEI